MRILIVSTTFWPSVGGLESVTRILADDFAKAGHNVKVLTSTPSDRPDDFSFDVVRCPDLKSLIQSYCQSDIVFHNQLSFRLGWPLILCPRRWVVTQQTWLPVRTFGQRVRSACKRLVLRIPTCVAISRPIAAQLAGTPIIIPNPYDDAVYYPRPAVERTKELIFVGRLVSEKGCDVLIHALARLKHFGLTPNLTVIGEGPERIKLKALVDRLGLQRQVTLCGQMHGEAIARELNTHRILVVPSRWHEPFGIVALEGIACGCVVVGSSGGGLPEAINSCGETFANGDFEGLCDILAHLLNNPRMDHQYKRHARTHLHSHCRRTIVNRYLEVFEAIAVPRFKRKNSTDQAQT